MSHRHEAALCEDRDASSAAGEGESHWDGSQAIMADEPAGFVHSLKSFLLIFYSWAYDSKWGIQEFFLYTVFLKKEKHLCSVAKPTNFMH